MNLVNNVETIVNGIKAAFAKAEEKGADLSNWYEVTDELKEKLEYTYSTQK